LSLRYYVASADKWRFGSACYIYRFCSAMRKLSDF
jgi:hypothetical protein